MDSPVAIRPGFPVLPGAQPYGTTWTLVRGLLQFWPHHVPAPLCSTVITRFSATTGALTPTGPSTTGRGSLIYVIRTSNHSVSNHLRFSVSRVHSLSADRPIVFGLRPSLAGSSKPPTESSSLVLRTGRSLPVALHPRLSPRRSYFQLLALQCQPGQGLSPRCPNALSGALAQVSLPAVPPTSLSAAGWMIVTGLETSNGRRIRKSATRQTRKSALPFAFNA